MTLDIEGVLAYAICPDLTHTLAEGHDHCEELTTHVAAVLREQIAAWLEGEEAVAAAGDAVADAWIDESASEIATAALSALAALVAPSCVPGEGS